MVGFFRMWSVSGQTTKSAKLSFGFHELGMCMSDSFYFESLSDEDQESMETFAVQLIRMKHFCDLYTTTKKSKYHEEAVDFLVLATAVMMGQEGMSWDWRKIRHHAQGLYGSMEDTPFAFQTINMPIFDKLMGDLIEFLNVDEEEVKQSLKELI